MAIPVLKPNAGDQTVCKKKNLAWLFGVVDNKASWYQTVTLRQIFLSAPHIMKLYLQLTRRVYKGIPDRIRGEIWSRLLGVHIVKMEQDGVYNVSKLV